MEREAMSQNSAENPIIRGQEVIKIIESPNEGEQMRVAKEKEV